MYSGLSAFGSAVYSGLSALLGGTRVEATEEVEVPSCTSSAFLQPSQLRSGVPSIGAEPFKPFLLLVFTLGLQYFKGFLHYRIQ